MQNMELKKAKEQKFLLWQERLKTADLIEVPMGMPLRNVIYDVGGGMITDKPFKGVQLGGPSGGCVPESLLDTSS